MPQYFSKAITQHWYQDTAGVLEHQKIVIKDQLPAQYGDVVVLNDKLREQYRPAENLIMFARKRRMTNVCEFLTRAFHPDLDFETLMKDEGRLGSLDQFQAINAALANPVNSLRT